MMARLPMQLECKRTYEIFCPHEPKFIGVWKFDIDTFTEYVMCHPCWEEFQKKRLKQFLRRWNANKQANLIMIPAYDMYHTTTLYTCGNCDRRVGGESEHFCEKCQVIFCVDCCIETESGTTVYINCPECKGHICSGTMAYSFDKVEDLK